MQQPPLRDHLQQLLPRLNLEDAGPHLRQLIIDDAYNVVWLASGDGPGEFVCEPYSFNHYLCTTLPASDYFETTLAGRLRVRIETLPFGTAIWKPIYSLAKPCDPLFIRWQLISEEYFRAVFLTITTDSRSDSALTSVFEEISYSQEAFLNQLSHEIRTPLAIASGSIKRVIARGEPLTPRSAEHLLVARQELQRMSRLVNHLSILTDIETGSTRWKLRPVELGTAIDDWYQQINKDLASRLSVSYAGNAYRHFVDLDPEALNIVLDNLLDNAIRYSPESSPVVLYCYVNDGVLHLCFADWGYGIPSELRTTIFDRFRRLEEHRDPARADGSGLGLAICRSLLRLMHGKISLLSHDVLALGKHRGKPVNRPSTVMVICLNSLGDLAASDAELKESSAPVAPEVCHNPAVTSLVRALPSTKESDGCRSSLCFNCGGECKE